MGRMKELAIELEEAALNRILQDLAAESVDDQVEFVYNDMVEDMLYAADPRSKGPDFDEEYNYVS